jgi:hypothetical protein
MEVKLAARRARVDVVRQVAKVNAACLQVPGNLDQMVKL